MPWWHWKGQEAPASHRTSPAQQCPDAAGLTGQYGPQSMFLVYRSKKPVSLYSTSNQTYGGQAPTVHEMPVSGRHHACAYTPHSHISYSHAFIHTLHPTHSTHHTSSHLCTPHFNLHISNSHIHTPPSHLHIPTPTHICTHMYAFSYSHTSCS